jgi:hypothetical protein
MRYKLPVPVSSVQYVLGLFVSGPVIIFMDPNPKQENQKEKNPWLLQFFGLLITGYR